jgi:hypothetical protein
MQSMCALSIWAHADISRASFDISPVGERTIPPSLSHPIRRRRRPVVNDAYEFHHV